MLLWRIVPRQSRKCFAVFQLEKNNSGGYNALLVPLKAQGTGNIPWDSDPNSFMLHMVFQTTDPMEHLLP